MTEDRKALIVAVTLFVLYVVCDVIIWWLDRRDKRAARVAKNREHIQRTAGQPVRISELPKVDSTFSSRDDVWIFDETEGFNVKTKCTVGELLAIAWKQMSEAERAPMVAWHEQQLFAGKVAALRASESHFVDDPNMPTIPNLGGYGGAGRDTPGVS